MNTVKERYLNHKKLQWHQGQWYIYINPWPTKGNAVQILNRNDPSSGSETYFYFKIDAKGNFYEVN